MPYVLSLSALTCFESAPCLGSPVLSASYGDLRELSSDLDLPDVAT
jgi:hypothetical protein